MHARKLHQDNKGFSEHPFCSWEFILMLLPELLGVLSGGFMVDCLKNFLDWMI